MDLKTDIYLNQLAQGVIPLEEGKEWFSNLLTDLQLEVLRRLVFFILQAGAIGRDASMAVSSSPLKATFTPCQLLIKAGHEEPDGNQALKSYLAKVINLPELERMKSFLLLVSLFGVADRRKRESGLLPEKYWWHRDLSKQEVIDEIIANQGKGDGVNFP